VSWRLARELLCVVVAVVAWGKCGRSSGRGYFSRRDGRDHSIMTARRRCRSVFHRDRGVARVGSCFTGVRARVGERSADTAGPTSKARGRACPFKTTCRARVQDFALPLSSSSRARIPLSVLFHIRSTTAFCVPSPRLLRRNVELDAFQRVPRAAPPSRRGGLASSANRRRGVEGS
jgi:hypothetical protein